MTYHSSKGLDFDAVALPNIQTNLGATSNENALILVALSRAKRDLLITYTNSMYTGFHRFLVNTKVKNISDLGTDDGEIID
jgi:superfamily I DNA/RNA helicase